MAINYLNLAGLLDGANWVFDLYTGGPRRAAFFDIESTRPELLELDRSFPAIRDELLALLPEKQAIPKYHELDEMQGPISAKGDPDKSWKVFYLYAMGEKPEA